MMLSERSQQPERTARSSTWLFPTRLISGWVFTARGVCRQVSNLKSCHVDECLLGGPVVRKWIGQVAGVALAPEAVLHQIHPFHERFAVEAGREKLIQLAEGALESGVVVARLDEFDIAPVSLQVPIFASGTLSRRKRGRAISFGSNSGLESWMRNANLSHGVWRRPE